MSKHWLSDANDWKLMYDFDNTYLSVPSDIHVTNYRPDSLVISYTKRILIIWELTVP